MTQDQWIILAFKVVEIASLIAIAAFLILLGIWM